MGVFGSKKRPRLSKVQNKKKANKRSTNSDDISASRKQRGAAVLSSALVGSMNGGGRRRTAAAADSQAAAPAGTGNTAGTSMDAYIAAATEVQQLRKAKLVRDQQSILRASSTDGVEGNGLAQLRSPSSSASVLSGGASGMMSPASSSARSFELQWSAADLFEAKNLVQDIQQDISFEAEMLHEGGRAAGDVHWGCSSWSHLQQVLADVQDNMDMLLLGVAGDPSLASKAFLLQIFLPHRNGRVRNSSEAYVAVANFMHSAFKPDACTCAVCKAMLGDIVECFE